eukprot:symbB.v1.2.015304.t1/scaffold1138.1/size205980/3
MEGRGSFGGWFLRGVPSRFRGPEVIDTAVVLNEVTRDASKSVFEDLRGKITTPSLDVPACMAVLRSVSTKKFWKEAIHLWQFMQQSGMKTHSKGCGHIAERFVQAYSWASSLVVIENMHHQRLMLDKEALGAMLEINCNRHLWQQALAQFFEEGPQNILGTSRAFRSLAVAGQLEQMRLLKKFIREKERYGHYLVVSKAFTLAHGWQDSFDLTQDLFDAALPPDLVQLEQVMAANSAAARWREACFLIAQRQHMGFDFSLSPSFNASHKFCKIGLVL